MTDPEILERVRQLRTQGRAPKQIARILGLAPSVVAPLIRAVAADHRDDVALPAVVGCWVNQGWSVGLGVAPGYDWPDERTGDPTTAGLVCVLLARRHRFDKVKVCGYLVDVYCLGVKNTVGPQILDEFELRHFTPTYFAAYDGWQAADVELARHLVFGAVDHARTLGFDPHDDFSGTADLLGAWTGPSVITFGENGRPTYVSGPYDDPRRIISTLARTVGTDEFEFRSGLQIHTPIDV